MSLLQKNFSMMTKKACKSFEDNVYRKVPLEEQIYYGNVKS